MSAIRWRCKLDCTICRAGKTGCSYSPFHNTRAERCSLVRLPWAGSNKVDRKQAVVEAGGKWGRRKAGSGGEAGAVRETTRKEEENRSGKRKHKDEDFEACLDNDGDVIACKRPCASLSSHISRLATDRRCHASTSGEVVVGDQKPGKLTPTGRA